MSLTLTRRDLARLITRIENGERGAQVALNALYPHTGRARVIGITGAPGSGKSTLVSEMARALRALRGRDDQPQVAIVAVDPSSPFSGGAILGDRIRMRDLYGDSGIFIRSMASRGALGGIAAATADVVSALDACGFEIILIETVGAGQLDVDVVRIAQTIIVVEAPGAGDEVQAVKAGILEIADVIAVNKADRDGVGQTVSALQSALDIAPMNIHHSGHAVTATEDMAGEATGWRPPIVKVSALNHEGIADLLAAVDSHGAYLAATGEGERRYRQRIESDIQARLRELLLKTAMSRISRDEYQALLGAVGQRSLHPAEAALKLLDTLQK
jgi:LAO/AO transport system kinase